MTEIHCEFCGPTRIAPHDPNCPDAEPVIRPLGLIARGIMRRSAVTNRYVVDKPITVETHPEMFSPIVEKRTDHYTVRGRRGAECYCGYNPAIEHPEAGRGQLFAYVGQHIKNESGI